MPSNETTYAERNYTMKHGASFDPEHRFQDENWNPTDITGRTFSLVITQGATTITKSGTVTTPANGVVNYAFGKTEMATLARGHASYEAKYTAGSETLVPYLIWTLTIK